MDIPDNNNDMLKKLLSDSKLEMPFSGFEDRVMHSIRNKVRTEQSINRNINLSWLFFALGTAFGLLLSVIISPATTIWGFPTAKLMLSSYIIGGTLILLFVEQLVTFTLKRKNNTADR